MPGKKKFKSIHIDTEKGIYLINGEEERLVSHLELEFNNGVWSLSITKDEHFEQTGREWREMEKEVKEILLDYLKKATGESATSADVANIPEVAKILLDAI